MTTEYHVPVEVTVNGVHHELQVPGHATLLQVLRDQLGLTGAKYGCGIGYCGACTVIVDGKPAHSCCLLGGTVDGADITTVESLEQADLHPVQQAMLDEGALQCGYCTPGFVMTICSLLEEHPQPSAEQVTTWLGGNICRCTGFASIVRAAVRAAGASGS